MLEPTEAGRLLLDAVESANATYERWSGGHWVSDMGAEAMLSIEIAKALYRRTRDADGLVTLEHTFGELVRLSESSYTIGDGPETSLRKGQRPDVVLWTKPSAPRAVIEVKHHWDEDDCRGDLERLREFLRTCGPAHGGSLQWAAFAVFLTEKPNATKRTIAAAKQGLAAARQEVFGADWDVTFKDGDIHPFDHATYPHAGWEGWRRSAACVVVRPRAR